MSYEADDILYVSELRQWLYCPRVTWYGRMYGDRRALSGLMKVGIEEEAERERLEDRRTFAAYGIEAVGRRYQVPVASERLGLRGAVDMIIETTALTWEESAEGGTPFIPVEVKTTVSPFGRPPMIQLCTYALMIEEMKDCEVPFGFLVTRPAEEVTRVEFTHDLRRSVEYLVEDVRSGLCGFELPPPTPSMGKCINCEFRRVCNDRW